MAAPSQFQTGLARGLTGLAQGFEKSYGARKDREADLGQKQMLANALEARNKQERDQDWQQASVSPTIQLRKDLEEKGIVLGEGERVPLSLMQSLYGTASKEKIARDKVGGGGKGRRLLQGQITDISNRQEGASSLAQLRSRVALDKDVIGPVKGRALGLMSALGSESPEVRSYKAVNALYEDVRQQIGKAKEGGVLREHDEAKYLKMLGSAQTPAATAGDILDELGLRYEEDRVRRIKNLKDIGYEVPDSILNWKPQSAGPETPTPATGNLEGFW